MEHRMPIKYGPLLKFTGNNPEFVAYWSATKQRYSISKQGKFITNVFRYRDAHNYLN